MSLSLSLLISPALSMFARLRSLQLPWPRRHRQTQPVVVKTHGFNGTELESVVVSTSHNNKK